MPRTARQALASLLIALHAAIALCGPGLHAAPGLGHFGPAGTVRKPDAQPEFIKVAATASEHCPICDYFAQGQLPLPPTIPISFRLVLAVEPTHPPILAPRAPRSSSQSRAPPCGDARTV
jgi:hypothetical protein